MEVILVLYMKIPASHVSGGQIVTAHFRRFNVPNQAEAIFEATATTPCTPSSLGNSLAAAVSVLVTNSDSGCGHSINSLENEQNRLWAPLG